MCSYLCKSGRKRKQVWVISWQPLPLRLLQPSDHLSLRQDGGREGSWLTSCLQPLSFLVFRLLSKGNRGPTHGKILLREERTKI